MLNSLAGQKNCRPPPNWSGHEILFNKTPHQFQGSGWILWILALPGAVKPLSSRLSSWGKSLVIKALREVSNFKSCTKNENTRGQKRRKPGTSGYNMDSRRGTSNVRNQFTVALPQHLLYFFPDPHGHGSFRLAFEALRRALRCMGAQIDYLLCPETLAGSQKSCRHVRDHVFAFF